MSDDKLAKTELPGLVVRLQESLESSREVASRANNRVYELQRELAATKESLRLQSERRAQLEKIVASAFARSVKMLSGAQKQFGASQDAAQIVKAVEEHYEAVRFLDEHEVPGAVLLERVKWLHDKATQTIRVETQEFFTGVDLGYPKRDRRADGVIDVEPVYDEHSPTIPAPPALPSKP